MRLRPEADWAVTWACRLAVLVGIPTGLLADRTPGASPPGVALDSVLLWRIETVVLVVMMIATAAFLALLTWRGVALVEVFGRTDPER